ISQFQKRAANRKSEQTDFKHKRIGNHPLYRRERACLSSNRLEANERISKEKQKQHESDEAMFSECLKIDAVGSGKLQLRRIAPIQLVRKRFQPTARDRIVLCKLISELPGVQPKFSRIIQVSVKEIPHPVHPFCGSKCQNSPCADDQEKTSKDLLSRSQGDRDEYYSKTQQRSPGVCQQDCHNPAKER